jgi:SAM-dependent methyltransferase
LDFGSGAGRLAVGIAEAFGQIALYRGVDVQRELIDWASANLGGPRFEFVHVDAANERYNPDGGGFVPIPADDADFDIVYAYSVFSHMRGADVRTYLGEFARILRPSGTAYLTAFVEDGVPAESVNPFGYRRLFWLGRLHCVRFERTHFEDLAKAAGFEVAHREHAVETDGQTLYVLRRLPDVDGRRS